MKTSAPSGDAASPTLSQDETDLHKSRHSYSDFQRANRAQNILFGPADLPSGYDPDEFLMALNNSTGWLQGALLTECATRDLHRDLQNALRSGGHAQGDWDEGDDAAQELESDWNELRAADGGQTQSALLGKGVGSLLRTLPLSPFAETRSWRAARTELNSLWHQLDSAGTNTPVSAAIESRVTALLQATRTQMQVAAKAVRVWARKDYIGAMNTFFAYYNSDRGISSFGEHSYGFTYDQLWLQTERNTFGIDDDESGGTKARKMSRVVPVLAQGFRDFGRIHRCDARAILEVGIGTVTEGVMGTMEEHRERHKRIAKVVSQESAQAIAETEASVRESDNRANAATQWGSAAKGTVSEEGDMSVEERMAEDQRRRAYTPGPGLRAWRDFFSHPDTTVYGLDVDPHAAASVNAEHTLLTGAASAAKDTSGGAAGKSEAAVVAAIDVFEQDGFERGAFPDLQAALDTAGAASKGAVSGQKQLPGDTHSPALENLRRLGAFHRRNRIVAGAANQFNRTQIERFFQFARSATCRRRAVMGPRTRTPEESVSRTLKCWISPWTTACIGTSRTAP